MLLSIHAGPLAKISRSNRLDWLDIGYQRLAPAADYKVILFKIGEGALPHVGLPGTCRTQGRPCTGSIPCRLMSTGLRGTGIGRTSRRISDRTAKPTSSTSPPGLLPQVVR